MTHRRRLLLRPLGSTSSGGGIRRGRGRGSLGGGVFLGLGGLRGEVELALRCLWVGGLVGVFVERGGDV